MRVVAWPTTLRRPMHSVPARPRLFALALAALVLMAGCQKTIGDACNTNLDCAFTNDRLCDTTQLGGYCTVAECTRDSCPDQATCVQFQAHTPRLARSYCMRPCAQDSDCRTGYVCEFPTVMGSATCPDATTPGDAPPPCTRILDSMPRQAGFCVQASADAGR